MERFLSIENPTLKLSRCPHCAIDKPNLAAVTDALKTISDDNKNVRFWKMYVCRQCGGAIIAAQSQHSQYIDEIYPETTTLDNNLPVKVKSFLQQALNTIHSPTASIMVCCSAVDEMLKSKGYTEDKIYSRIKKATADHLLTEDMSKWAHQIRLDANEQRHADQNAELPTTIDAERTTKFALALAEFLVVLPSRVTKGIEETTKDKPV